jgi:hypothetical protein
MCNPRQVRVRATHRLAEAWQDEIRRQVTVSGEARGRASLREPLDASLGGPVLAALEQVMADSPDWEEVDGGFRRRLDGGYVQYHADTRELEIVAEVAEAIQAAGVAGRTIGGILDEEVEIEGVGRYYDDGWGGRTEARARREAEADLDEARLRAGVERRAAARDAASREHAAELDAGARADAMASLERLAQERSMGLDRAAAAVLASIGVQGRAFLNQALAQAYRDAILAFARSRRAEGIRMSESGGVLDIEFEMEI